MRWFDIEDFNYIKIDNLAELILCVCSIIIHIGFPIVTVIFNYYNHTPPQPKKSKLQIQLEKLCSVCLHRRCRVRLSCGHQNCVECALKLHLCNYSKCSVCRKKFKKVLEVF